MDTRELMDMCRQRRDLALATHSTVPESCMWDLFLRELEKVAAPEEPGDYVTAKVAAGILDLSRKTVCCYCGSGLFPNARRLPGVGKNRQWRIPRREVHELQDKRHPSRSMALIDLSRKKAS